VVKKKINPIYQKQIEQIKIDSEDYADKEMKPIYSMQKSKLDEVHNLVGKLFITYAVEGLLKVNQSQKPDIITNVNDNLKSIGKELGQAEVEKVTSILSKNYEDTYNLNAFIIDSGLKVDLKFDLLKKEYIDKAVNQEFKGELFSDRIWKNKADMIDKLKGSIIDAMNGNTTIDRIGREIKNTFNVTAYESQRLVRTENARIQSQAIDDIAINTGVKQQMFCATLDLLTNPVDASFEGNIYNVDDESKPEIPLHPNCRCLYINIPNEDWKPTQRKDNETKEIISYTTYNQWLKDKGISKD
jgi:SPP1 gp7 family putative phage head morphogenesis protein